jgi:hypothetical protein
MGPMARRLICGAIVGGVGWLAAPEISAQGVGSGMTSMGTSGVGASAVGGAGSGASGVGANGVSATGIPISSPALQTMPNGVPLFSPTVPSSAGSLSGVPSSPAASGGLLSNPIAAPLLMNSMLPNSQLSPAQAGMYYGPTGLGTTQLGLLMLANQQRNGGIGSGQLSGTRSNSRPTEPTAAATSLGSKQRPAARPGGLAARYFTRPTGRSAYPQRYFNRQTRYFP